MYEFQTQPQKVKYHKGEPFKLHKDLNLFHNKMRIRKLITGVQNLFKERVGIPLDAPAIRDTYFRAEYTDNNLILLCSELDKERELNQIFEKYMDYNLNPGGFELEVTNGYIFLKAPDESGFEKGIKILTSILDQTFKKYFEEKIFEEYIEIPMLSVLDGI
jgi:hypothetical protein